ncbi:MAG: penicillin acylase family protein, partial [Phycisphaerales bacterium]|nr:penicillin acylase family protein [Phycisphaerales bacterium]
MPVLKALLTLTVAAAEIVRSSLTGNMAAHSGRLTLESLEQPVIVDRSGQGVPTIRAESLLDAVRAQGFVHAQDRYFQMDMMRRFSAGRLSEVMGEATVGYDLEILPCEFQRRADEIARTLPPRHARMLEAYTEGVNAGLAALNAPPFEYLALGISPEPWQAWDCVLVGLTMFDMLAFGRTLERQRTT